LFNQSVENSKFIQILNRDRKMIQILNKSEFKFSDYLYLNSKGFLLGDENEMEYKIKIMKQYKLLLEIERFYEIFKKEELIPMDHFERIFHETSLEYDIQVDWLIGFYSKYYLPNYSGGCSYETNIGTFIQINPNLKKKETFYSLNRNELLIHEVIHSSRINLKSKLFEEEFAFSLSRNYLRRNFSTILSRPMEFILFYLFSIFSLSTDYQIFPKWFYYLSKIPFITFLLKLFIHFLQRKIYLKKCSNNLMRLNVGKNLNKILFRLKDEEIIQISSLNDSGELRKYLNQKKQMRWKIIISYFFEESK
jgi:hypothetical protein